MNERAKYRGCQSTFTASHKHHTGSSPGCSPRGLPTKRSTKSDSVQAPTWSASSGGSTSSLSASAECSESVSSWPPDPSHVTSLARQYSFPTWLLVSRQFCPHSATPSSQLTSLSLVELLVISESLSVHKHLLVSFSFFDVLVYNKKNLRLRR